MDGLGKLLEFADVEEVASRRAGQVTFASELTEELEARVRRCCATEGGGTSDASL